MRTARLLIISAIGVFLLAAAALAGAGQGTSNSVMAAGGEIRVLEAYQQVNYPAGVALTVSIESNAEISEVRVYYRPAGSRKWGYAYADFDPGTRVIATCSIPVQESTYIAPGADVEYYYQIRDVAGNVLETDRAMVEYLDQRFNWQRVNVGPLELVYHDIGESRIHDTAQVLREDLGQVQAILGLADPKSFKGVIYNSYSDANAAFPVQSQTTTDHGTFAGYAFPEQGVFLGNGLDRRIIVHESAHLMLRDAIGNKSVEMPAWLNEGFASYMEPDVRVKSSQELYERTPHLRAMGRLSGTPDTIPLFYQKSVSVVAHLIETYGEDRFRLLLEEISRGRETNTALVNVYGFDDHGLDSSWAGLPVKDVVIAAPITVTDGESLDTSTEDQRSGETDLRGQGESGPEESTSASREQTGPSSIATPDSPQGSQPAGQATLPPGRQGLAQPQQRDEPSPFIYFDIWILVGAALLAAVVLSGRFIYSRLRRRDKGPADPWETWQSRNDDYD